MKKFADIAWDVRKVLSKCWATWLRIPRVVRVYFFLILAAFVLIATGVLNPYAYADESPGDSYSSPDSITRQDEQEPEPQAQTPLEPDVSIVTTTTRNNEEQHETTNQPAPAPEPDSGQGEILKVEPVPVEDAPIKDSDLVAVDDGTWALVFEMDTPAYDRVFDDDGKLVSSERIVVSHDSVYWNEALNELLAEYRYSDQSSVYDAVHAVGVVLVDSSGALRGTLSESHSDLDALVRQFVYTFARKPERDARVGAIGIYYGEPREWSNPDGAHGVSYGGVYPVRPDGTPIATRLQSVEVAPPWGGIYDSAFEPVTPVQPTPAPEPGREPILPDPAPAVEPEPEEPELVVFVPEPIPVPESPKTGIPAEPSVMVQTGDSMPSLIAGLLLVALTALAAAVAVLITIRKNSSDFLGGHHG